MRFFFTDIISFQQLVDSELGHKSYCLPEEHDSGSSVESSYPTFLQDRSHALSRTLILMLGVELHDALDQFDRRCEKGEDQPDHGPVLQAIQNCVSSLCSN